MPARFEIDVFAYVMMGNYYHLLVKTERLITDKDLKKLYNKIKLQIQM